MQQTVGSVARIAVVALWSSGAALAEDGIRIVPQGLPAIVPTDTVEISISNLMGTPVVDATGADLGQIADVIVDGETGRVARLVISKGGIAGFFDSKVAVDASAVRLVPVDGRIVATGLTPDEVQRYSGAAGQD
jgi:sporulation protein YlmC with PRC-barrel domain